MQHLADGDDSRGFLVWTLIVHVLGTVAAAFAAVFLGRGPGFELTTLAAFALAVLAGWHLKRRYLAALIPTPGGILSRVVEGNMPVVRAFEARLRQAGDVTGWGGRRLLWISRGWIAIVFACLVGAEFV